MLYHLCGFSIFRDLRALLLQFFFLVVRIGRVDEMWLIRTRTLPASRQKPVQNRRTHGRVKLWVDINLMLERIAP